ncbi:D-glycero-beta-D-manno-heptose 1-phosphate adenylyltransferase [Caulobacter sp. S45]|uniref:D-glycero-beta-D-manno-heptose 1-phosphate adenylyltransferase n=1 Tax=Caulobacter sp. S45 TaxID=1641861 RepID=UPI001576C627|nr:D-glycero-beta-D-manno-heptose 1-phosphate adenylyltransferase [Caulobacter sp. S45]
MLIDDISGRRVLVVGDVMLDHFVRGVVERVSPEAPVLVVNVTEERSMAGGAANVAANVAALGGHAVLVGVVGDDPGAALLDGILAATGGITNALVRVAGRPTTQKTRYLGGDRHLLRADRERVGLDAEIEERVVAAVFDQVRNCEVVVISDYAKGVACPAVVRAVIQAAGAAGIPVAVDPKRGDVDVYRGARLLTPNRKEMRVATGEDCADDASCDRAGEAVCAATGASVLLTRSERGVCLYEPGRPVWRDAARAQTVRDVSGAGDTVIAAAALALAAGAELQAAAHLANTAAAVAVSKSGTSYVTPQELNQALLHGPNEGLLAGKLVPLISAAGIAEGWRHAGLRVGFTNGCFDLLHPGHVGLLAAARALCDRLVVGLNTDQSISRLKGPKRPVQSELARAEVIGALRSVDLVVLFGDDTPLELIGALRPAVLVKGADYTVDTVVGANLVLGWGGRVELVDLVPDQSSTRLIARSRLEGRE